MNEHASDVFALFDALESVLAGSTRSEILDRVTRSGGPDDAFRRLRASMSAHGFEGLPTDFGRLVRRLDNRTRQDGFRVLHAWDHTGHRFTDDLVPALMVDFVQRAGVESLDPRTTAQILLDYYLLHLLALAAMRAWDTDEPAAALDGVTRLLDLLQGPDGSGHRFAADAETLLIHALSQFHPEEQAYDRLIERVATLPRAHGIRFARVSAAVLGAHLRWGFWLMYERDVQRMRDDNVGDYPWLLWSVTTLLRAWTELADDGSADAERRDITGSLLLGLAADPWALGGRPPAALKPFQKTYDECLDLLTTHGPQLLDELETHRPDKETYAPLSFLFNFPHNALVAGVALALLEGRPRTVAVDDLFEAGEVVWPRSDEPERTEDSARPDAGESLDTSASREAFARDLMAFSRGSPDRLGYRGAMLVAYDPLTGIRTFSMTMKALRRP